MKTNKEKVASWSWRRKKAGLTLRVMASLTGCSAPQLSNYETGKNVPSSKKVDIIEKVLTEHNA